MTTISVSMTDEELAVLDALAKREKRSRSNLIAHMAENWDTRGTASKSKEPKAGQGPLPGADGKLVFMMDIDPRTLRPGSKWLRTWPDHLPLTHMKAMPWAYRPDEIAVRTPKGVAVGNEKEPPLLPAFIVKPDDPSDWTTPLRVYAMHGVVTDHLANTPKTKTWTKHLWSEALEQWVPDPDDLHALSQNFDLRFNRKDVAKSWREHHAYGAETVEQLKELLTALEGEFNLSADARAFVAGE